MNAQEGNEASKYNRDFFFRKLAVKKWKESGSSFGGWWREESFLSSDLDWFDVQIFKN